MAWDKQLPACFGAVDLKFAVHPADEGRAFTWLKSLRDRGVTWQEARDQIREYLKSRSAGATHITAEVTRAHKKLKPWLSG